MHNIWYKIHGLLIILKDETLKIHVATMTRSN